MAARVRAGGRYLAHAVRAGFKNSQESDAMTRLLRAMRVSTNLQTKGGETNVIQPGYVRDVQQRQHDRECVVANRGNCGGLLAGLRDSRDGPQGAQGRGLT